ncbi:GNAT family N-acetyltransferase [Vreelandella sp. V005]|uniref:GNAT family N-acetyltransferase n=1 Tax=Vreelandella sp. V005 TaxID=3459608 RepID=UPI004044B17D
MTKFGLVNAIVDLRLAGGKIGEIASLLVSADHRGQGVSRVLLQHAQAWLGEWVSTIRIRTNVVRSDTHLFYTSAGYIVAKEQNVFLKDV